MRLVLLPVRVLDRFGHPLEADLPQGAFEVYEDGIRQSIRVFEREDAAVSMGLVVDHSGSMSYKLEAVRAAAVALVRNSNPSDEVFVVSFGRQPYLDADFTQDEQVLGEALRRGVIRGNTALWDALGFSLRHMKKSAHRDLRVLIVISDGQDVESSTTASDVIQEAQESEVTVYSIGLGSESRRDRGALRMLADSTGGEAFFPKALSDLDGLARRLAHDIRRQYLIGYSPANSGGEPFCRKIAVTLEAKWKATVRTRTGYCASRQGSNARP